MIERQRKKTSRKNHVKTNGCYTNHNVIIRIPRDPYTTALVCGMKLFRIASTRLFEARSSSLLEVYCLFPPTHCCGGIHTIVLWCRLYSSLPAGFDIHFACCQHWTTSERSRIPLFGRFPFDF